jgi:hypothetical protein
MERPPTIQTELAFWPGPTIPVCFVNPEADEYTRAASTFIPDEIERKWGRYAGIGFTGWNACTDESIGVKVTFVALDTRSPCIDELGGIDRIGYPGIGGSVNLKICMRYTDAEARGRTANEALIRLVALHEFGHVLGFDDLAKYYEPNEFMASAINGDRAENYLFDRQHVWRLQQAYGRKPSGSLVDARGHCLTVTSAELGFEACDGNPSQAFDFKNGQLWHAQTGNCLHADSSTGAIDLSPCVSEGTAPADEQSWLPDRDWLRGFGGQCVTNEVYLRNCLAYPSEAPPSGVEFVDGGRRIRIVTGASTCAEAVEPSNEPPKVSDLGACDSCTDPYPACTDPDRFKLESDGRLEIDGRCFETPVTSAPEEWAEPSEGAVVLLPCALRPNMYWNLTSRWVNQAGQILTRSTDTGTPVLVTHPIEDAATPNDFFDFYWREAQP